MPISVLFKKSLLDTYTSTLAQWGDQTIETKFIKREFFSSGISE